jgi:hypothetical protein
MNTCTNCDEGAVATHTTLMREGFINLCDKCYND